MSVVEGGSAAPSLRRLPFTIRLSPQLVNQLFLLRSRASAPEQVTGLLFGVAEDGLLIAQGFYPFTAQAEATGASEKALQDKVLERELAAAQKQFGAAALNLIGWYAVREVSGLTASDLQYHEWYFPRAHDVALILKSGESTQASLEIYCRTAEGVLSEEGYRIGMLRLSGAPLESAVEVIPRPKIRDDFFLRAYDFADEAKEDRKPGQSLFAWSKKSFTEKALEKRDEGESAAATERSVTSRRLFPVALVAIAVATMLLVAGAVLYLRSAGAGAGVLGWMNAPSGLALKVETQGDRLLLSWNRERAAVKHARNGSLKILDGAQPRRIQLDARQVANGSILYRPKTDDVTFDLDIEGEDGEHVTESVRVLDAGKPVALDVTPREQEAATEPAPVPGTSRVAAGPKSAAPLKSAGQAPALRADALPATGTEAQPGGPEQARAKEEEVRATPEETLAKPAITTPPAAGGEALFPTVSPAVSGEAASNRGRVGESAMAVAAAYQAPRPLRQVLPNLSNLPASVVAMAGQLEVMVTVNAAGVVTEAHAVMSGRRVNAALMDSAVAAARQWRFEPARLRNAPVASQHSILFQFARR